MTFIQTLIAFFVALGVLIVVHELGHYWVARWCGVKVLRFSVGMGKVVFSRRIGPDQTEWALSALPFGGYVKMLDAREQDLKGLPPEDLKREFTRQSVWKRFAIVAAGPLANFLLAIIVFAGLYSYGIPEPSSRLRTVAENTAAYQVGLRGGELVTAVNGESVRLWTDLRWKLLELAIERQPASLEVERPNPSQPGSTVRDTVTLRLDGLNTSDLESDFLGKLGIDLARPRAVLGKIVDDGPAMRAGLKEGDEILQVNGKPVIDGLAFVETVRSSPGKPLEIAGLRSGREFVLTVTPEVQTKNDRNFGMIKAEVPMTPEMITASEAPLAAVGKAVKKTWDSSVLTVKMLGKMLIGEVSWKNITGPITIADYAGQTARIGIISYLTFIAFISISLGVMNLLPIPVLDGGHLLYYSLEVLTGRPVSERVGEIAQRAGVGILMTLMAVAVFNDIMRLMT
ncbi:MAG TPA: RIP metalloprotease RseP [Noviherbaspirillum sp.]|jgi:regulator of sigma E protease|uniref:RIP metalloprotease RseP n=1 Tax=Noviherbaspirillum sp. TaxID=1926288 RepID=UPI002DDCD585|nr:RIP metalloprotease RseP [Noviherbaspirillum sp.]HEV2611271.1 RIP metalloprotease RseP [Noviherbaspirillum sp.]